MLSTDDADLYDLDINGELSLVMLFTCNHLSVYRYPVCLNKIFNQDICYFLMLWIYLDAWQITSYEPASTIYSELNTTSSLLCIVWNISGFFKLLSQELGEPIKSWRISEADFVYQDDLLSYQSRSKVQH